ncbi:alpha/beta fold hydrolase [Verrucomicrobiota bacterium sgz303538]
MKSSVRLLVACFGLVLCQTRTLEAAETDSKKEPAAFTVQVSGAGRAMILIPGLSCGSNVWDGTVAHFRDTYQCHVVTLSGFAGQPAIGDPFLKRVREGLAKYIQDKKLERPIIIGHSLGGFLAFWLAASIPDKVGPVISVDGVPYYPALRDANASPQSSLPAAQRQWMGIVLQTPEQFARNNHLNLEGMITGAEDLERIAEVSNRSDPKAVGQAFFEMMTIDLRPTVKEIQAPLLLIGATAAIADPSERKRAEENYRLQVASAPRHKVVFAPRARHFIQLDEPEFFIREVEAFLKTAEPRTE